MVAQLIIHPTSAPLVGSLPVPSDQGIALCRMGLAALSRGKTTLRFRDEQRSIATLLRFLKEVGVQGSFEDGAVEIQGAGLWGLKVPTAALDLRGDSEVAGIALGLLVSRPFESELIVDDLVAQLLGPALREAHEVEETAEPDGGRRLRLLARSSETRPAGISLAIHGFFPWIKWALLLSGLRASSPTMIEERFASADHLERVMIRARMPLDVQGTVSVLHPPRDDDSVAPQVFENVGSTTMGAALVGAALMRSGSAVTLREICTNPTRSDFYSVARHMGAEVAIAPLGDRQGEPFGNLSVRSGGLPSSVLRSVQISGENAARLGDEVIVLLGMAARAKGVSVFTDLVTGKRGGDTKIWSRAAGLLASAGVQVERTEGGIVVTGREGQPFLPVNTTTGGDSRLALLASLLALGADKKSVIDDVDCLAPDFPRWSGCLRALGAKVEVVQV